MKNLFKLWLLAMVAMAGVACEDNDEDGVIIMDFFNYPVYFTVVDAGTGADLLDPATEENILDQKIKVIYNGAEYPRWTKEGLDAWTWEDIASTRYYPPMPFALRWGYQNYLESYVVAFGEFAPDGGYHQESFIIEWGDGTQNEIVLDCYKSGKWNNPTVNRALWVDGVAHGKDWCVVVKK